MASGEGWKWRREWQEPPKQTPVLEERARVTSGSYGRRRVLSKAQKPTPVLEEGARVTSNSYRGRRVWPKAKKSTIGLQNRIVFGTDATIHRHPYQVNRHTLSLNLLSLMSATI